MMPPPPWLNISPQLYLGAAEAGAQTGLAQRRQDTTEQEAADRLQLNYLQLQEQAKIRQQQAAETLRAHSALEQYRQQEILNRQQLLSQQQQAAQGLNLWRQQQAAMEQKRLGLSEQNAQALNLFRQQQGQFMEKRLGLAEQAGTRAEAAAKLAALREERLEKAQAERDALNRARWNDREKAEFKALLQDKKDLSLPSLGEMFGYGPEAKEAARIERVQKLDKVQKRIDARLAEPDTGPPPEHVPHQGLSPSMTDEPGAALVAPNAALGGPIQTNAPAAILPLPKSKEQLVKGQLYQTSRGPGRWNGEVFELEK